ncbi:hypothetical protein ACFFSW_10930 [Saccharothrix longispora]|uniref:Uncharacterized protein n=1 Tax=Saccharothrix longispora TaxID=33920 RepID=A0ABU1Q6W6_9PSEU|nr:hypothetical protein [Saccharothrix longispora]MDR6598149.1 hypothetical protein [Saccharothrix longispora]
MRRRLPRVARWVAVLAVLVVLVANAAALWRFAGAWWHGALTGDTVVWGLPLRNWGRIGKLLQFVAGATVVLKLVGPERFAAWGAGWDARRDRALARAERSIALYPLASLRRAMEDSLVHLHFHPGPGGEGVARWEVSTSGPPAVGTAPLAQADVDAWHAGAAEAVAAAHTCAPHPPDVCEAQVDAARAAVGGFLRDRLGPERWEELGGAGQDALDVREGFFTAVGLLLSVLLLVAMLHLASPGPEIPVLPAVAVLLCALAIAAVMGDADRPPRTPRGVAVFRVVVRLRTAPVAALMRLAATVLVKAGPSHAVEWFAFVAFAVGFGLDFAAS